MGWIKKRINAEYKKHYKVTGGLDWSLLAEKKIVSTLKHKIDELIDNEVKVQHTLLKEKLRKGIEELLDWYKNPKQNEGEVKK